MTLGITKAYTPSAGQVSNAASYNTDIAALFNAFSGLEAQSATLGGLTITPTANSTTKFNVTNAAGTSIFSVDTTNGLPMYKTKAVVSANIANTTLTDDFSTTSTSYTARTGGSVTLTTLKAASKVMIMLHSNWYHGNGTAIQARINVDSGDSYIYLGQYDTANEYTGVIGFSYYSSASAAAHTFSLEVKSTNGTIYNQCTTGGQELVTFSLTAMEI